jgi:2-polyprenyl-3-methyl-5-hydroxy-6-metoxy-1,4-benzoquinol methylase
MYMDFHFNDEENFAVKNFPLVCGQKALKVSQEEGLKGRALDIGCAVGRTTIELASHFDEVIGIDLSNAFIGAANNVLNTKYANLANKVKFIVGDACKLEESLGKFSLIFGGNLIDRLYNPEAFLLQVAGFL